jgi:ubiquitin C
MEDYSTLQDYSIQKDSTLRLVLPVPGDLPIFVRAVAGKVITLEVEPTDPVVDVKAKIQQRDGIPADRQRFIIGGNELEDGKTLRDYSIQRDSTLDWVVIPPGA